MRIFFQICLQDIKINYNFATRKIKILLHKGWFFFKGVSFLRKKAIG